MTLITTYSPLSISFTHGKGIWLYDQAGEAYLDSFSGIAVCGLGHAHPDITQTIQQQASKLLHTSNTFDIPEQQALAKKILTLSGMDQVFFSNSGAEANEAAIKLSRLYGHKKGIETPSVIVMDGAFHGRTMATLTASGNRHVQAGFEPLVPGFIRAPFNDIEAIRKIAAHRDDVVAVMLEPIQGEAGVYVADPNYLRQLASICEKEGWLFILDENQTGNGRTGQLFAYMSLGLKPDVVTTAKGLGNGIPIGACLMSKKACNLFQPGNHGSTFGGNQLACATALTVLEVIENQRLCEKVTKNSLILREKLMNELSDHPHVLEIRGKGYMIGIELDRPAKALKNIGLSNRILLNITAESVVRLLPALIINEEEIDIMVSRLVKSINEFFLKHE